MTKKKFLDGQVEVVVGDITEEKVDAIVNAANSSLMGGGGVDGAIHRAGGPAIKEECKKIRDEQYPDGLPTGKAVITTGGRLEPKVIHTVGPVYQSSDSPDKELAACYKSSLKVAAKNDCHTVSFPAISTGIYGFPKVKAAEVVSKTLNETLPKYDEIDIVRLVFFAENDARVFLENCQFSS
ncbi:MAG: O-acetyl-ADP-ribose deacetylase [Promethearchaeia archaeon]